MPTADQLYAWVTSARPGETIIYHCGPFLSGAVARLAYHYYESGLVLLTQRRVGNSNFAYIATRASGPHP